MTSASPRLTIVVNFYNMQREAPRTLYTMSAAYQRDVPAPDYEVIAIDNGSPVPLDAACVTVHGENFFHVRIDRASPSPCAALNAAVARARGEFVMVCIDGARMFSPGIVHYALDALTIRDHPFVYTLGMHLGPKLQNVALEEGYDQRGEDALLNSVDWRSDGYELFTISSIAGSAGNGFLSRILSESNCFAMRRDDYLELGGLDERFTSPGGGLVNLAFFDLAHAQPHIRPILILGEATFHQFHGGVATNVPLADHPWNRMAAEYAHIYGKPYVRRPQTPEYIGWLSPELHAKYAFMDDAADSIVYAQKDAAAARDAAAELSMRIADLERERDLSRALAESLQSRIDSLTNQLQSIHRSRLWRIRSAYRRALGWIRRPSAQS